MMMIVRMYPRYEVDKVWEFAEKKFSGSGRKDVLPLFMSEQDYQNFVSVMLEVSDPDALVGFFENEITQCKEIADTRTVPLLKPAFFPVPKSVPPGISRFLIPVKIDPRRYTAVFDKILNLKPPEGIHFAYVAGTIGEDDMLISILAKDWDSVRRFVSEKIETMDGVESLRVGLTNRTKRLTDPETWKQHQEKYSGSRFTRGRGPKGDYDYDWTYQDKASIDGALPDEP